MDRFCEAFFALLERLWHKNQTVFRSLIRNILIDPSIVDDVLQEAFVKLLESNKQFTDPNAAYGYIRKVVLSTSIDHYRYRIAGKPDPGSLFTSLPRHPIFPAH